MELSLESLMPFGQHAGKQIEDLIEDKPGYIAWLIANTDVDFDKEVLELITKKGIA